MGMVFGSLYVCLGGWAAVKLWRVVRAKDGAEAVDEFSDLRFWGALVAVLLIDKVAS